MEGLLSTSTPFVEVELENTQSTLPTVQGTQVPSPSAVTPEAVGGRVMFLVCSPKKRGEDLKTRRR